MLRRSLFGGLTVVLAAVVVYLVIRARGLEKQQQAQPAEIVRESRPTATRVFAPSDIEIVDCRIETRPSAGANPSGAAASPSPVSVLVIRNNGERTYQAIGMELTCLDGRGKTLSREPREMEMVLQPGQARAGELGPPEAGARHAKACSARILYADLRP